MAAADGSYNTNQPLLNKDNPVSINATIIQNSECEPVERRIKNNNRLKGDGKNGSTTGSNTTIPRNAILDKFEEEGEPLAMVAVGDSKMESNVRRNSYSTRYGWSDNCSPSIFQFLANRKAFLVFFSATCVLQGTFHTYFVAVITTLEKLFSIPSKTTGALMMASEIGQVSSALLLPYYAGQGHRPRWMGMGAALFAFATLLCASPHVLIPPVVNINPETSTQFCTLENITYIGVSQCSVDDAPSSDDLSVLNQYADTPPRPVPPPYFLFAVIFISLLTIGLGQTAVYTLGIPYLDDNVASRDSPLYFSITIGVRILGPVTGFVLGSLCTRLYIYPGLEPEYGPTDPRWLGAWWLGMVIISILLFLTAVMMFAFPPKLKTYKQYNKDSSANQLTSVRPKIRNFPTALKRLLSNKILMLRTFSSVFHLLPISGLYTFLPKYLESQFRLAAFQANMVAGIAGILVMGVGIFASGVWIRKREPSARAVAFWVAMSGLIYALGMFLLIFIGCDSHDFSFRQDGDFRKPNCDTQECADCSDMVYAPVCGSDSKIYFSPCHAGCTNNYPPSVSNIFDTETMSPPIPTEREVFKKFLNCSCLSENETLTIAPTSNYEGWATSGLCPLTCTLFPLYLTVFMFIVLVHSTCEVGSMLLTLRCVEPRDKAMALGLIQCAIGLFGNVPCPVIYGAVVDRACTVWGRDCNGDQGHCWMYDSKLFRTYFHGTTGMIMLGAFFIDIIVYFQAKNMSLDEEAQGYAMPSNQQRLNTNHEQEEENEQGKCLNQETSPL